MKRLTLTANDYLQLKQAFMGGFTHANASHVGETYNNVDSFDFASSYPYVMLSEQFPMSKLRKVKLNNQEELEDYLTEYCCLFDIEFENIESIFFYDNYISLSKCIRTFEPVVNNGRVVCATKLAITVTEQDFFIIKKCYRWSKCLITNFKIMDKAYLPTDFVKAIIKLYKTKTELKGVEGKEAEYMVAKENLNSCYGMTVTDICREVIEYEEEWLDPEKPDIDKSIKLYNSSVKRFLFYAWGIWVTAYARRNLWMGIFEFKDDYIYADTDSIKCLNAKKHLNFINRYNETTQIKLKQAMRFHNISYSEVTPKNKYGVTKLLGIWDWETKSVQYVRFKTLGAKRYIYTIYNSTGEEELHITVAGLNKNIAAQYLVKKYGIKKCFDMFNDGLKIPPDNTGKLTHTYLDFEMSGEVVDYLGNKAEYHEMSGVHLEPASYELGLNEDFVKFILGVKTKAIR